MNCSSDEMMCQPPLISSHPVWRLMSCRRLVSDVSGGIGQIWFQILKQQRRQFLCWSVCVAPERWLTDKCFNNLQPHLCLHPLCLKPVALERGGCGDQRSGDEGIQSITSNRLSWENEARDQSRTPRGDKSIRGREMEGGVGGTSIAIISVIVLSEFHSQHDFIWRQWQHSIQHSTTSSLLLKLMQPEGLWGFTEVFLYLMYSLISEDQLEEL